MKKALTLIALSIAALAFGSTAMAQDHSRNWQEGNIIATSTVHIKPGMFNAYINDLNGLWRKFLEQQKKDGNVVSYRVLSNQFAREGEPDLILVVEYPNWAAFDLGSDYFDKLREKIVGSESEMRELGISREELRTLGGSSVYQEIKFKK